VWLPLSLLRRHAAAIAAGLLLAVAPAGVAAAVTAGSGWHSWNDVRAAAAHVQSDPQPASQAPAPAGTATGVTIAAAGLAGIVGTLALMLTLVVITFAAFFLLGAPALILVMLAAVAWGTQVGFGGSAPLQPWLVGASGVALLALALNTGSALPIYWSLVFGSGRRLDRLREAWSSYWTLFRGLVIPSSILFGLVVFRLLAAG